jgi:hypothetical protein
MLNLAILSDIDTNATNSNSYSVTCSVTLSYMAYIQSYPYTLSLIMILMGVSHF